MVLFVLRVVALVILGVLGGLVKGVSFLSLPGRGKRTVFECGFNNLSFFRLPFSIQFFLVGVLFLIFDVEISWFVGRIAGGRAALRYSG